MAEELETGEGVSADQNLQTLDALHLDGKGAPTLDEADERSLIEQGDTRPDDVTGNANVQSAGRTTYEQMVQGGIREQPVIPTSDNVAVDTVQPTFRDNSVAARFDNVQPTFANAPDLPESERRPEAPRPAALSPDQLVTRDPQVQPRGDGEPQNAPAASRPAAAAAAAEEEVAPPQAPTETPAALPDEVVIPKVADAPSILLNAASGTEDRDTKLDITIATADRDGGNETISSITIGNVPAGFSFVNAAGQPVGSSNGDGTWSFLQGDLKDLYLRQPEDYSGDITLNVSATSLESNGTTATTTTDMVVHVEAVADAPDLTVAASGTEDRLIPLSIAVGSNDAVLEGPGANAPETISVITISNVPTGFSLVTAAGVPAGVNNGGGSWSFTTAELADLYLKQPGNYSGELTLAVSATSLESNGSTATTTTDMVVHVEAVADAPALAASASGTEDRLVPLSITVGSNDAVLEGLGANAPETISVITVSNVPTGFSLVTAAGVPAGVNNGGGSWSFTPAELADLYLKQPANYSGELTLTVAATSLESNGSTATTTTDMVVHVAAVADAPALTVADSAGMENALIPLSITLVNHDSALEGTGANAPESQLVYIADLPAGAALFIGDDSHAVVRQVGGLGLLVDGVTIPAGSYIVDAADLPNLMVRSATNDSHDFTLRVWATSTEGSNGSTALTGSQTIEVDVGVNAPSAAGSGTAREGAYADLNLSANVNYPDGSENLRVFISDLPAGANLLYRDGSAVPQGSDGRYEITGRLSDLKVGWTDTHSDTDIRFNLVAEVRDGNADSDSPAVRAAAPDFASTTVPVTVAIQAVADGPSSLAASGIGVEDKWFALDITTALIDPDSETLSVTIAGPAGFQLADASDTNHPYSGTLSADGSAVTYTLTQSQLAHLQMRAKADSDTDVDLTITATGRETATGAGQIAVESKSLTIPLNVKILSDADKPVVSVIKDTQTIQEDGLFNLGKSLTGTFSDGAGSHAAVTGASAEAGSAQGAGTSADGSETIVYRITANQDSRISLNGGTTSRVFAKDEMVEVSAADIASGKVRVGGPTDWASSGAHPTLTFKVVTVATEANAAVDTGLQSATLVRESVRESDSAILTIAVDPVADAGTARLSVVASGYEDSLSGYIHTANATGAGIAVTPTLTLTDADLSEAPTGTVVITSHDAAMIAGTLTVDGATIVRVDTRDGAGTITGSTWTVTGGNFSTTVANTFTLNGLKFHPAANNDADPVYDISVQFQDTASGTTAMVDALNQTITVTAIADAPALGTHAAGGYESDSGPAGIDLRIDAALTDTDGSETLFVYVTGIPGDAATLSAYQQKFIGDVTIGGVTIHGTEGNPVYKLAAADLANLKLQVNQGYSEDMQLSVYAESVEARGGDVAVTGPVTLNVDIGVLAPTITGADAVSGTEDGYASLSHLVTNPRADDATDTISVYVEGLADGAKLYKLVGGTYTELQTTTYKDAAGASHMGYDVTALRDGNGALSGVYVKWDATHKADDISFTLRSVVADSDNDTDADAGGFDRNTAFGQSYSDISETTQSVTVVVKADADAPTLTASAIGVEDKWVNLAIASSLVDTDGSETLTITVSGVPAGVQLSAGTIVATDASGVTTWSIGPANSNAAMQAQLSNLRLTNLPANSDVNFDLTVRATATERETGAQVDHASASTQMTINVNVLSDADKPVVSVIKDTQTIKEDGWFNLSQSLTGTFSDGTGTHAAVTGASGESGSLAGATASADSSETLTYRITPKEAGTRLMVASGSDANGDGVVTGNELTDDGKSYWNADGYWEVPAALVTSGKVWVAGKADWANAGGNDADRIHFDIQTVATETRDAGVAAPDGLTRHDSQISDAATLTLKVDPVADGATVSAANTGYEDQSGGITVSPVLTLTDTDRSERPVGNVSFTSTDGDLAGGHFTLTLNGQTTTITPVLNGGVYSWEVPAAAFTANGNTWTLSGLKYFPQEHLAKDVSYSVSVDTQDVTGGVVRTLAPTAGTITITAVADKPDVSVVAYQNVESVTAQDITLSITPTHLVDADGSETVFVYVTGVPAGKASLVLANGTTVSAASTGNITVDGQIIAGSPDYPIYKVAQADLAGLKLNVTAGYSDDMALKVWSVTEESQYVPGQPAKPWGSDTDVFHAISDPQILRIDLGVRAPGIALGALSGNENAFIQLSNITTSVTASDGSETIKVYIEDLIGGAKLFSKSGSTYTALTTTTYTDAQGVPHTGYDVSSLRDTATGKLTGVYASWNASNGDTTANSDADITFNVRAVVWDGDADAAADAGGLHMETAYGAGSHRDINETVQAATVIVKAVADAPSLNATAVGVEDKWVNLNIASALNDTDGSESLTVTISGLPAGLTLCQGTTALTATGGVYTLTAGTNAAMRALLSDLRITGLTEDSGYKASGTDFTLTVTATATESASGATQVTTPSASATPVTVNVVVYADADTPTVTVVNGATAAQAVSIQEDGFYNLAGTLRSISGEDGTNPLTLATQSADGSETLSFTLKATQESRVWIDTNGDGKVDAAEVITLQNGQTKTVSAADVLANKVWVGGPANWGDGTIQFKITPTATESDAGTTADFTASNDFDAIAGNNLSRSGTADGVEKSFYLRIDPVADETTITASGGGLEDAAGIKINASIALTDRDDSEKLTGNIQILVKGPMDGHLDLGGATLTGAGTVVVEGQSYTIYNVPVAAAVYNATTKTYTVDTLSYVPNHNSDADLTYRIRSFTHDGTASTNYETTSGEGTLVVQAVADAPLLKVGDNMALTDVSNTATSSNSLRVAEDGYLNLKLDARLSDSDGSETLTAATLTKVPDGWTVVRWDATANGGQGDYVAYGYDGTSKTWTLDAAHLDNVYLHPPRNSDLDAPSAIVFSVTSTEHASGTQVSVVSATTAIAFDVAVDAVADKPTLSVTSTRVLEDEKVKLEIRTAVTDTDGSESLSVSIGNTHDGSFHYKDASGYHAYDAGHYNGATGTWTFSPAEIGNLYFQPKAQSNDAVALNVTVTSTESENGSTATNSATLAVKVTGVADPAQVDQSQNGTNYLNIQGTEGQVINPHLQTYLSVDTDGSESLSVVLSDIPNGVTLFLDDNRNGALDSGESSSGFLKFIGNGRWSVSPEHVQDIRMVVPEKYSGTFQMGVSLITTENDGDYEKVDATMRVTVNPVANTPNGSIGGGGSEDGGSRTTDGGTDIAFTLNASVSDTGGGGALGVGGVESVNSITNVVVDVDDMVRAVLAKGGLAASVYVSYGGTNYAAALVDDHYAVTIPSVTVPVGQTSVSIGGLTLHGVPGDYSTDVHVSMSVTAKDGASISAGTAVSGNINISAVADTPLFSIAADGDATPDVHDAVAHTVTLSGVDGHAVVGVGDTSESLYLVVSGVPNGVVVQGGINNGNGSWTLPGGTSVDSIKLIASGHAGTDYNGDGTYGDDVTLTLKAYVTDVDPDGDRDSTTASVTAKVNFGSWTGGEGGTPAPIPTGMVTGTLPVAEDGAVALSSLHIVANTGATTVYDSAVSGYANGVCTDGSVISLAVKVPAGWSISGSGYYLIDEAGDTHTYSVRYSALGTVKVTPPHDFSGDTSGLQMRVVVTTADGRYDTASAALTSIPVQVQAVADGASISANAPGGTEDGAATDITLTIRDVDVDHSESMSNVVVVRVAHQGGVAPGTLTADAGGDYTLSAGVDHGTYTEYTVTLADVSKFVTANGVVIGGLHFDSANDFSGSVSLTALVDVTDKAYDAHGALINTSTKTSSQNFAIAIAPQVDDSDFTLGTHTTNEDVAIALDVSFLHSDVVRSGTQWSSETMSVVIGGVPQGAHLEGAYNNGDGTWTVYDTNVVYQGGQWVLSGVKFVPAPDSADDVALKIVTYAKEAGGTEWVMDRSADFTVVVKSVADGASVNPQAVTGTEDVLVALQLGAQVQDASETAIITINGIPAGAFLTDGTVDGGGALTHVGTYTANADGTVSVELPASTVSALNLLGTGKIYFAGVANVSGSWTMSAKIVSVDVDADTPHTDTSTVTGPFDFTVTLVADADVPTLTVASNTVTATEDQWVSLDLSAVLKDQDGSESLSLTIADAPEGAKFTVTYADGTSETKVVGTDHVVTVSHGASAITGVTMLPPLNHTAQIQLKVTATSVEASNADHESASQTITVNVTAVDDKPTLGMSGLAGLGIAAGMHQNAMTLTSDASHLVVSDVENDALASLSLTISGAKAGDALGLTGVTPTRNADGDLVISVDGKEFEVSYQPGTPYGTLTFSGSGAGYADYQNLLSHHVVFTSSSGTLAAGVRNVQITVTDAGSAISDVLQIPVTVAGAATVKDAALGDVSFTAGGGVVLASEPATTAEDTPLVLDLDIAHAVTADMAVVITGVPVGTVFHTVDGAHIVAGVNGANLTGAQLANVTLDLPDDWNGSATLTVSAAGLTQNVALTATAVNDAPTTTTVALAGTAEDGSFSFTKAQLLINAADVDGDSLTIGSLRADHGVITDNGNGNYTYTPAANYHGADTITYAIGDGHGGTVTGTANFTVSSVNDAPALNVNSTAQTVPGTDGVVSSPLYVVPHGATVGISDVDGTTIKSMTVHLLPDGQGHYALGDTLGLYGHDIALNQSCQVIVKDTDIRVDYDAANHTLTFTGNHDYATYADLAKSVVLSNTGGSLAAGARSFSITLYDDGNTASQSVNTSVTVGDGTLSSLGLSQNAHGTVYWNASGDPILNGTTPELDGTSGADTLQVHVGSDWAVNGGAGSDTLMLDYGQGGWTFEINASEHLVHVTSTSDPSHTGIIRLDDGVTVQPFAGTADQVVFNGSANGTIDFGLDHVVTFQNLEKVHG